jgi:hypothetical protein
VNRLARRSTIALLTVVPLLMALATAPGRAAGAAGVTGIVVDATVERPVPAQRVLLLAYEGETPLASTAGVTDARGRVTYGALPSNATSYQLVTTFRGGTYRSPMTEAGTTEPVRLRVYRATTDAAAVAQTNWVVWIDPMPGGILVQQDLSWQNDGKKAYIGSSNRGGVVTRFPLAPGAHDVQVLGLYLNGGGRVHGTTYEGTQPIVPGSSTATVRYVVPSLTQLRLVSPMATGNLHLFVADTLTATAPGMRSGGTITDRGTTYRVFTAANVAADRTISIALGAAVASTSHAGEFVAAGIAILLLMLAVAVWRFLRRRRRTEPARPAHASRPARPRVPASATAAGPRSSAVTSDADVLLEEIAAVDIAFEEGLIAPDTYERVRAAAKERLAEAMTQT